MSRSDRNPAVAHPPVSTIEDTLTFKIARFAALNARDGAVIFRRAFGLTLNEWRVLGLVAAHAPLGLNRLAELVLMDKGQLSRTVQALGARGMLASIVSPQDARKVALSLTDKGRRCHDDVLHFAIARNEEVVTPLTPDETRAFIATLDRLLHFNETLVRDNGNL